jgi:hypothetical protein
MPTRKKFPLRIGNVILCEDVRQEMLGKHSLLGVISGDILVPVFEDYIKIAVYVELLAVELGEKEAELTIQYLDKMLAKISAKFDFKDLRAPAAIVTPGFPLKLEGPGQIIIDVRCEGKTKRAMVKEIRASAEPFSGASIAPVLPSSQSLPAERESSSPPEPSRPARPARRQRT